MGPSRSPEQALCILGLETRLLRYHRQRKWNKDSVSTVRSMCSDNTVDWIPNQSCLQISYVWLEENDSTITKSWMGWRSSMIVNVYRQTHSPGSYRHLYAEGNTKVTLIEGFEIPSANTFLSSCKLGATKPNSEVKGECTGALRNPATTRNNTYSLTTMRERSFRQGLHQWSTP